MATTTVNGGEDYSNPHNPHLVAMRQASERVAQAGETLVQAGLGQPTAVPSAPQRRPAVQSVPAMVAEETVVDLYEPAPVVAVPEPKSVAERVQGYLQRQIAVTGVLVLAGCLIKKTRLCGITVR